jgi:hypothetical protein
MRRAAAAWRSPARAREHPSPHPHFRFEYDTSELAYAAAAELSALGYDADVLPGVFRARDRWELKARGTPEGCTPDEADKAFERWTDARSGAYFRGHETPRTAADAVSSWPAGGLRSSLSLLSSANSQRQTRSGAAR